LRRKQGAFPEDFFVAHKADMVIATDRSFSSLGNRQYRQVEMIKDGFYKSFTCVIFLRDFIQVEITMYFFSCHR
jgi:hypothetical protein